MKNHLRGSGLLLVALGVAGCRTVGPDFSRPQVEAPAAFKHAGPPTAALPPWADGGKWWQVFADPALDDLESAALAQSPTLAAAVARVEESRARLGLAHADARVNAAASGTARLAGESAERTLPVPGRPVTYRDRGDTYRAAADAGFELDLWGRVKRSLESAEAQVTASEADRRAVRLILTADVAQAYHTVRTLDAMRAVLQRTLAVRREGVDILQARVAAGLSLELDLNRARTELALVEADLAEIERRREQAVNALAILTGRPPAQFAFAERPAAPASPAMPSIPVGLPSSLLQRRPDLAASEATLRARNAEIGAAEALRFPVIRLTGGAGFESADLGSLLGRPSQFWQLGPSVALPLLDGGRVAANVSAAQARMEGARADYRQRALVAFREVEDALVDLRQQAAQAEAQARAADSAQAVVQLANVRYERGFATYLDVVDAQRSLLQIERTQAELDGARRAGTVRLIRALGGGWD